MASPALEMPARLSLRETSPLRKKIDCLGGFHFRKKAGGMGCIIEVYTIMIRVGKMDQELSPIILKLGGTW